MSDVDRSKWVVPIVVASITAIATVIAALITTLNPFSDDSSSGIAPDRLAGYQGDPFVEYSKQGELVIAGNGVDLDAPPRAAGGDHIEDLIVTSADLTTGSGARLAFLNNRETPTLESCREALDERGVNTVDGSEVEVGSALCIRTTAGRTGTVTPTDLSNWDGVVGLITFSYVIWGAALE